MLGEEEEAEDPCKRQWLSNYQLSEVNAFSLFDEFLEMGTQRVEGCWVQSHAPSVAGQSLRWGAHRRARGAPRPAPCPAPLQERWRTEIVPTTSEGRERRWPGTFLSSQECKGLAVTPRCSTSALWDPHRPPSPTAL